MCGVRLHILPLEERVAKLDRVDCRSLHSQNFKKLLLTLDYCISRMMQKEKMQASIYKLINGTRDFYVCSFAFGKSDTRCLLKSMNQQYA